MNRGATGKTSKESHSVDEKNHLKRLKGSNTTQKVPETGTKQSEISRFVFGNFCLGFIGGTYGIYRDEGLSGCCFFRGYYTTFCRRQLFLER